MPVQMISTLCTVLFYIARKVYIRMDCWLEDCGVNPLDKQFTALNGILVITLSRKDQ